ncbi:tRNA-queuosine alpha-mannosyltransferase domain-containing protein [Agaribacterium haliotis]|uniref:tRNA-queuosine alpha-mannosyltransferase domain-containing protein n=1 Tax=Agaribacterium haliotis TaxID=2013869 RepID=UPI000BB589D7|nr:DUF3524 domain-containing protein [Agaribacterium haliotis]
MRVLLLSAYDAASHRSWREGLCQAFTEFECTVLTLPARHFAWRIRGNALYFADQLRRLQKDYDLLIATSMVDVAGLKGLYPALAPCPTLVFFHENQFAYPDSASKHSLLEAQLINFYSALAADYVVFNSAFNRRTFFDGLQALLQRLPDAVPANTLASLEKRSAVLAVGLADDIFAHSNLRDRRLQGPRVDLVWNHRWEYDKGPERLLCLVKQLDPSLNLSWHIVGQRFRKQPSCMAQLHSLLNERGWLGSWGPLEARSDYLDLLRRCDVVVSTALHDFQGLAVLEAMACGCVPLVPKRLAYPEYIAHAYCYDTSDELEREAQHAAKLLQNYIAGDCSWPANDVDSLSWQALRPAYQRAFKAALDFHSRAQRV